jgi:hypothetical protein
MDIYKYIGRKYLKEFTDTGKVRIGNIYWYRDCENEKIRDEFEGRTKYVIAPKNQPIILSQKQADALTIDYHIGGKIKICPPAIFSDFLNVPNAFVFCASINYSKDLKEKFDCDAYYKIVDIQKFATKIIEELNKKYSILFSVTDKVCYVPSKVIRITNKNKSYVIRADPFRKDIPNSERIKTIFIEDYFTKPLVFQGEEEFRIVFVPRGAIGNDPVYVESKQLLEYCEF